MKRTNVMRWTLRISIGLLAGLGMVLQAGFAPLYAADAVKPGAKTASGEKPAETKKFDDWVVACGIPEDQTKKVCQAVQTLTNKEDGKRVMQIMVGYPEGASDPVAIFVLPLGYLLQSGGKFELDGKDMGVLGAERCVQSGCIVPLGLGSEMLAKFKSGTGGKIVVTIARDKTVDLPVSLKGFSAALGELKKG
ncbi:MAG: invasion associated locus B family protein [Alphaproteobacteria bacterium]|nr:invasion associated locus B family protein [Alphaproteobacteria bacterium]